MTKSRSRSILNRVCKSFLKLSVGNPAVTNRSSDGDPFTASNPTRRKAGFLISLSVGIIPLHYERRKYMCPYCENQLGAVNLREITVNAGIGNQYVDVAYSCPFCRKVLSVSIDPVALKTDTIEGVVAALRR